MNLGEDIAGSAGSMGSQTGAAKNVAGLDDSPQERHGATSVKAPHVIPSFNSAGVCSWVLRKCLWN